MSSKAQIKANRLNGQKSTGAASPEGKAKSRFNSLKSGIYAKSEALPGEDPAQLDALAGDFREEYQPHTPTQVALVDSLTGGEWLLRRLRQSLTRLWQPAMENGADLGQAYQDNPSIDRAMRRIEGLKRSFHRDLRRLEEILEQEARAAAREAEFAAEAARTAAVREHAELVRMLLAEKDDDGTPVYTRAEAQSTASFMQQYGVRTVKELDEAMDAECVQEEEYEAGKQAKKAQRGDASEKPAGRAGDKQPGGTADEPELASFRPGEQHSVNEPDPGDE